MKKIFDEPLCKSLRRKIGHAVSNWKMINEGDNILVGLSGGKDSLVLLHALNDLTRRSPIKFSVSALTVKLTGMNTEPLEDYCAKRDINYKIIEQPQAPTDTLKWVFVEKMPAFPGGEQGLLDFIGTNVRYPEEAKKQGISGKVFVGFVVETDGSVSNVKVLQGIGGGCDEEAVRVVKMMPNWIPGEASGEKVRVMYMIPINFRLTFPGPQDYRR